MLFVKRRDGEQRVTAHRTIVQKDIVQIDGGISTKTAEKIRGIARLSTTIVQHERRVGPQMTCEEKVEIFPRHGTQQNFVT